MSEKLAYKTFKNKFIKAGDRIHRIENPIVPGMPDVNICIRPGFEFWMEIKTPKEPARKSTALFGSNHKVSQAQMNWALSQCQAGGHCFFLIDTSNNRFLVHGSLADYINHYTVSELKQMAFWWTPCPTMEDEWMRLRFLLTSLMG